jgi:hypothetical protein
MWVWFRKQRNECDRFLVVSVAEKYEEPDLCYAYFIIEKYLYM